nr:mechanosensitive ion channel family protein [Thaumasiovibrio subtropicus]
MIVGLTILAFIIWRIFSSRTERWIHSTSLVWGDAIWYALRLPVNWMIVVFGLSVLSRVLDYPAINAVVPTLRQIAVSLLFAWGCFRFIGKAEAHFVKKGHDPTTVNALGKVVGMIVVIFAFLSIIQSLGVSISGILAFGGMGGLVVGMAAKDLLANFFGAAVIYFDRPFKVGDWIRSPDRSIEGTVERIGWRITVIRTFDKRPLYVPNSVFANIVVENPSRMTNRRIYETIGIRYADAEQMSSIVKNVKAMLTVHPEIDTRQTMIVNFNAFGPSSMDFFVYTFTKTTNWVHFHEVKHDVLLQILKIIEEHQAEIAFPTQTLHVSGEPEPELMPEIATAQ